MSRYLSYAVVATCLVIVPVEAQSNGFDPYAAIGYELREDIADHFGYSATGSNYDTRRTIGNLMDVALIARHTMPGMPIYHPFFHEPIRNFTRAFFLQSLDEMLEAMDAATPTNGVRVYYVQSSGIIIEAWLPNETDGTLEPYRVGVDISDDVVTGSQALAPYVIAQEEFGLRWASLADRLDAVFASHVHNDHWCARLVAEMLIRGKPVAGPALFQFAMLYLAAMSPSPDFMMFPADVSSLVAIGGERIPFDLESTSTSSKAFRSSPRILW